VTLLQLPGIGVIVLQKNKLSVVMPMFITAVLIAATGIIYRQPVFTLIPLFVSLVVTFCSPKLTDMHIFSEDLMR